MAFAPANSCGLLGYYAGCHTACEVGLFYRRHFYRRLCAGCVARCEGLLTALDRMTLLFCDFAVRTARLGTNSGGKVDGPWEDPGLGFGMHVNVAGSWQCIVHYGW